jgi:hypothetical protein
LGAIICELGETALCSASASGQEASQAFVFAVLWKGYLVALRPAIGLIK